MTVQPEHAPLLTDAEILACRVFAGEGVETRLDRIAFGRRIESAVRSRTIAPEASSADLSTASADAMDAARYRWLRDQQWDEDHPVWAALFGLPTAGRELDAAVDAAIAAQASGTKQEPR